MSVWSVTETLTFQSPPGVHQTQSPSKTGMGAPESSKKVDLLTWEVVCQEEPTLQTAGNGVDDSTGLDFLSSLELRHQAVNAHLKYALIV